MTVGRFCNGVGVLLCASRHGKAMNPYFTSKMISLVLREIHVRHLIKLRYESYYKSCYSRVISRVIDSF